MVQNSKKTSKQNRNKKQPPPPPPPKKPHWKTMIHVNIGSNDTKSATSNGKEWNQTSRKACRGGKERDEKKVEEETLIWAVVLNISSQGRGNQETQHQYEARSNLRAAAQWVVWVGFLNRWNEVKSTSCTWVVSRVNLHVRKQVKTWFYTHKTFYLFIYIGGHLKIKKATEKHI